MFDKLDDNGGIKKGKVIVTIAGKSGVGKSLISKLIENTLVAANVEYVFDDENDFQAEEREIIDRKRSPEDVVRFASKHVAVTIKERPLLRTDKLWKCMQVV